MSDEKKRTSNFLWPKVTTLESAKDAAMGGAAAAGIVAVGTLGLTLYAMFKEPILDFSAWSLVDVALFAVIAFAIWRWQSRTAAVAGLLLYLLEVGVNLAAGPSNPQAPIMTVFYIMFMINGIRGAFSYQRLAKAGSTQQSVQDHGGQQGEQS